MLGQHKEKILFFNHVKEKMLGFLMVIHVSSVTPRYKRGLLRQWYNSLAYIPPLQLVDSFFHSHIIKQLAIYLYCLITVVG